MRNTKSGHIKNLLKNECAFRLLRSPSAHLVISFLYETFRVKNISSIPSSEIENSFAVFLQNHKDEERFLEEDFSEETENSDLSEIGRLKESFDIQIRAKKYINAWCSEERGFIRRYYNQEGTPVIELSPGIERLFTFLDESEPKEFVGTESRFRTILFQLRELNQNINADAETRIAALKQKKKEIDEEIKQIQTTGTVKTYSAVQVHETLEEILRNSRSLFLYA